MSFLLITSVISRYVKKRSYFQQNWTSSWKEIIIIKRALLDPLEYLKPILSAILNSSLLTWSFNSPVSNLHLPDLQPFFFSPGFGHAVTSKEIRRRSYISMTWLDLSLFIPPSDKGHQLDSSIHLCFGQWLSAGSMCDPYFSSQPQSLDVRCCVVCLCFYFLEGSI